MAGIGRLHGLRLANSASGKFILSNFSFVQPQSGQSKIPPKIPRADCPALNFADVSSWRWRVENLGQHAAKNPPKQKTLKNAPQRPLKVFWLPIHLKKFKHHSVARISPLRAI
jgi:hypothetical protein